MSSIQIGVPWTCMGPAWARMGMGPHAGQGPCGAHARAGPMRGPCPCWAYAGAGPCGPMRNGPRPRHWSTGPEPAAFQNFRPCSGSSQPAAGAHMPWHVHSRRKGRLKKKKKSKSFFLGIVFLKYFLSLFCFVLVLEAPWVHTRRQLFYALNAGLLWICVVCGPRDLGGG
jgi:hypothetical protein